MDAVARRLHQLLVQALLERDSDAGTAPVTVAEIYQELVPYRAVRERIGVELNADYEHALLRLLAGEDELLRLEPASARDELRQELTSPNPYVGIYRKFAACDVWVTIGADAAEDAAPAAADPVAPAADATPNLQEGAGISRPATTAAPAALPQPVAGAPSAARPVPTPPAPQVGKTMPPTATRAEPGEPAQPRPATGGTNTCNFCSQPLPAGRQVRFCPHCGKDQRLRPCGRCGETLEQNWRYCIACGTPASATALPAIAEAG